MKSEGKLWMNVHAASAMNKNELGLKLEWLLLNEFRNNCGLINSAMIYEIQSRNEIKAKSTNQLSQLMPQSS